MDAKKIFIVEDEKSIRQICKRLLAMMGHEAVLAANVREAVETLSVLSRIDLLVTDIRLPDGDGAEVIQHLRRRFPSARVLIITGSPVPEPCMERLYKMGFDEDNILSKPFEINQFTMAVLRHLE